MNLIRPTGMRFQIQVSGTGDWTIVSRVPSNLVSPTVAVAKKNVGLMNMSDYRG